MRAFLIIIIFIFSFSVLKSQQTTQYTQFTFNKTGYNPAASGISLKSPLEAIVGTRSQWRDVHNGPKSNFAALNYTFIPKRSYRRWHNIGAYVEQDNAGVFVNMSYYLSYTIHLRLSSKLIASFGVFAGARQFSLGVSSLDKGDPAVLKSTTKDVWGYPDVIPGMRLYSKKMFMDVCMKQTTVTKTAYNGKQLGNNSRLTPTLYFTYGRKIFYDKGFCFIPALNVHGTFSGIPSAELNLMVNYQSKVSAGMTIRNTDFMCAILQVRIYQNCVLGFAYDYSINKYNVAAPNTIEFMMGITPGFDFNDNTVRRQVSACPKMDF